MKPDAQQSTTICKGIRGNEKHHNAEKEWLKDLRVEQEDEQLQNIVATENMIRQQCKKTPN